MKTISSQTPVTIKDTSDNESQSHEFANRIGKSVVLFSPSDALFEPQHQVRCPLAYRRRCRLLSVVIRPRDRRGALWYVANVAGRAKRRSERDCR